MQATDIFKFGKFKGSTLEQVAAIEAGRSYLRWFIEQQPMNPAYANADKKQKDGIRAYLSGTTMTGTPKVNPDVSKTLDIAVKLDEIIKKQNEIETKIDIILALGDDPKVVDNGEEQWEE